MPYLLRKSSRAVRAGIVRLHDRYLPECQSEECTVPPAVLTGTDRLTLSELTIAEALIEAPNNPKLSASRHTFPSAHTGAMATDTPRSITPLSKPDKT